MPPKRTQAKEIQELQEKLAQQERLLEEKEKTIRTRVLLFCSTSLFNFASGGLREAEKAREFEDKNRIPIPQGQAGRGEGYNLFEEMGVSKETFQALRVCLFPFCRCTPFNLNLFY